MAWNDPYLMDSLRIGDCTVVKPGDTVYIVLRGKVTDFKVNEIHRRNDSPVLVFQQTPGLFYGSDWIDPDMASSTRQGAAAIRRKHIDAILPLARAAVLEKQEEVRRLENERTSLSKPV